MSDAGPDAFDAHNRREVERMWRTAGVYAAVAVAAGAGTLSTGGVRRRILVGISALFGVIALWVALRAIGVGALVRVASRRRP
jgi:hypothetical protein